MHFSAKTEKICFSPKPKKKHFPTKLENCKNNSIMQQAYFSFSTEAVVKLLCSVQLRNQTFHVRPFMIQRMLGQSKTEGDQVI